MTKAPNPAELGGVIALREAPQRGTSAPRTRPKPDMGSIEERYGGRSFRATWRANGRRENRSFTTYDEARDFLNAMAINIRQGGVPVAVSKSRTPFEDFAWHWLACETKDRSKKESILKNHLVPAPVDQGPLRDVEPDDARC